MTDFDRWLRERADFESRQLNHQYSPNRVFQLAARDPVIGCALSSWRCGSSTFEQALVAIIAALESQNRELLKAVGRLAAESVTPAIATFAPKIVDGRIESVSVVNDADAPAVAVEKG